MDLTGFALAVLLIELTPGPNMAWLAMLAATEGRRNGLAAAAGIALGLTLNGVLAAAGLALIIADTPWLWTTLRWAGAAMMVWLAIAAWRDAATIERVVTMPGNAWRYFAIGASINLLNPKAFIFYVLIVPPFLAGVPLTFGRALILMTVSVTIATAIHLALVSLGDRAHRWVADPARTRVVRRILALSLLSVAAWFLLSSGR